MRNNLDGSSGISPKLKKWAVESLEKSSRYRVTLATMTHCMLSKGQSSSRVLSIGMAFVVAMVLGADMDIGSDCEKKWIS
jgi:hypothetical protein